VWFHRGAWWVKAPQWRESLGDVTTLEKLVQGTLGDVTTLEKLVQGTQFLQAESVRYAVEANRRRQYQNSGSLPWQFNEPYPMAACTSAVDYFGHPKPLYYAVARAYAPLLVAARFASLGWADQTEFEAELWGASSRSEAVEGTLRARLVGLDGTVYAEQAADLALAANAITTAGKMSRLLDDMPDLFFLYLALLDQNEEIIAYNRYLFTRQPDLSAALDQPPAQIAFYDVDRHAEPDMWRITVYNPGSQAALFVWLEDARARGAAGWPYFSDNYFCLMPLTRQTINVQWDHVPLGGRQITVSGWNIVTTGIVR
jgi:beta-mannosidase